MAPLLRIKNWEQFQHYTGARGETSLPWIKLYRGLLQDYAFQQLDDAARWHLIGIWLLAAGNTPRGTVVNDAKFLQRAIGASEKIDLPALIKAGWLLADPASMDNEEPASTEVKPVLAGAASTEERRGEKKRGEYSSDFETAWSAYPPKPHNAKKPAWKAWLARVESGVEPAQLIAAVEEYARQCLIKGTLPEFVMQAETFFGPNERWVSYWQTTAKRSLGQVLTEDGEHVAVVPLYDEQGNPTEFGRSLGL